MGFDFEDDLQVDSRLDFQEPKMYKVFMHNDDYSTMDFVVEIIMSVFNKDLETAQKLMLDIHNKGRALMGVYTYDIAISKIEKVHQLSARKNFPLMCTFEEE